MVLERNSVLDFAVVGDFLILLANLYIEQIQIPKPKKNQYFRIYKISIDEISALCGAFNMELDSKGSITKIAIAFSGNVRFS